MNAKWIKRWSGNERGKKGKLREGKAQVKGGRKGVATGGNERRRRRLLPAVTNADMSLLLKLSTVFIYLFSPHIRDRTNGNGNFQRKTNAKQKDR
jgi:hypothetical protein